MKPRKRVVAYAVGIVAEECCEAGAAIARAVRFSDDILRDEKARARIYVEVGDVLAAIDYAVMKGVLDLHAIKKCQVEKAKKLREIAP